MRTYTSEGFFQHLVGRVQFKSLNQIFFLVFLLALTLSSG